MSRVLLTLVFLLPMASSCATAPKSLTQASTGGWEDRGHIDLMVRVQNDHYLPVRITAVWEHMNYYLGEVVPGSTAVFQLPGYLLESRGSPKFLADPKGSAQDFLTAPVNCADSHWVEWRLKRNLHQSRPFVLSP